MSCVLFSKEDCDYVKSFWDESVSLNGSDRGKFETESGDIISVRRNANLKFLDLYNTELLDFIIKKISEIGIKTISNNVVKIVKYSQGDFFAAHRDFKIYDRGAVYKTLVIQLSDSLEYIGGDLYVKDKPQPREQGSYSLFLSSDIHEVKLVEDGVRFSLTIFLYESDFSLPKTKLI